MKRPRVPLKDALVSARALLEVKCQDKALAVINLVVGQIQSHAQWQQLREALERGFEPSLDWAVLYSQTLTGTRATTAQIEFTNDYLKQRLNRSTVRVLLERTWALLQLEQYQTTFDLIADIMPLLTNDALGVAHRRMGLTKFALGLSWHEEFIKAQALQTGRTLGLTLIESAACHQRSNQPDIARQLLTEALPLLRGDAFHLAWARYNLGEIAAMTMNPDAERHYNLAEQLTRRADAQAFRSRAWQGIGKWRRYNQDLLRAEAAFRQAIRFATESDDIRAAHWSLGRTLRLKHRANEALEMLELARQIQPVNQHIDIEQAACWLSLNRADTARAILEGLPMPQFEPYKSLFLLLKAELSRLGKQGTDSIKFLEQVRFESANAREELGFWRQLHAFAQLAGLEVPNQQTAPPNTVQVEACGILQVRVNQIPIAVNPTGRVGETLALLLELDGFAHVETIIEYLYPNETIPNRKKRAVWDLIKRLRLALGWHESVKVQGNTIKLDPNTVWQYDATQVRAKRQKRAYLEGIKSNWALEIAQELAALESERPQNRLIN